VFASRKKKKKKKKPCLKPVPSASRPRARHKRKTDTRWEAQQTHPEACHGGRRALIRGREREGKRAKAPEQQVNSEP